MHITTPSPELTVTTPNAAMTRLAAPSLGSGELSVWRVRMVPGARGPVHAVDREQVWTVTAGALEFTAEGRAEVAEAGQTVTVPAGAVRQVCAGGPGDAEALVAMVCDGTVELGGQEERVRLPWAE
ncbi:cupin domain-containing protein [Streptomyces fenghuangensis]